jgi:predicted AAA+ superfamily ATPase
MLKNLGIMSIAMDIRPIVEAQNPWWREPAQRVARHHPVRRELQPVVLRGVQRVEDRRALLVLGPRQVGKTTLLEQVVDDLLEGGWPPTNVTYFDFSDDRLVREVALREVAEIAPVGLDDSKPRVFLFDEISKAPSWDLWLKQAVDGRVGRIVATDSAASMLRGGARESGQGRWDELQLEGLSFAEYSELYSGFGETSAEGRTRPPARHPQAFERYLAVGGFPEYALAENLLEVRRRLRSDIVERAVLRDLAGRVEDPGRARDLFVYLMQDSGGEFVSSHRADDLGADRRSVESWVELLEETFLLSRLERRREKASKRLRS